MSLNLGNGNIGKAYLGGTEIKKCYLGSTVVFDNAGAGATGGILTINITSGSNALPSVFPTGNYSFSQASTDGSGSGAVLLITCTGGNATALSTINQAGTGYAVGDEITLEQRYGFGVSDVVAEITSIS